MLSVQQVQNCKDYDYSFPSAFMVRFEEFKGTESYNRIRGPLEGCQMSINVQQDATIHGLFYL